MSRYEHRPLPSSSSLSVAAPPPALPPSTSGAVLPAGSLHPSAQRLGDLLEFVRSEFEQVTNESGALRAQREEYEAMSEPLPSFFGSCARLALG